MPAPEMSVYRAPEMPWFIDLTGANGDKIVINLNRVSAVVEGASATYIHAGSGSPSVFVVKETIAEIWGT